VIFVAALVPSAAAVTWYTWKWGLGSRLPLALALGAFFLAVAAGALRMNRASGPAVKIGVGATNDKIELFDSADPLDSVSAASVYEPIVKQLAAEGAEIVVLPEKLCGVTPATEASIIGLFAQFARDQHVWLVAGLDEVDRQPERNIAAVFGPDGTLVGTYVKRRLAGEMEKTYAAGTDPLVFDPPWGRTAIAIGEDLDFAPLARELSARKVHLVLAPAWDLGHSGGMHALMTSTWATEFGIPVARAAREGSVSLVDTRGRTVADAPVTAGKTAVAVAELHLGAGPTFTVRAGEWFGWLSTLVALGLLVRFGVGALYDRSRDGGRVNWRHIEVAVNRADSDDGKAHSYIDQEEEVEVLHYRR